MRQGEQALGISYKKLKEIQNRQITEMSRMTPDNVQLYNQISTIARQAPADEKTQEEWILAAGKAIVQAQKDNKSARELYGSDLEEDIYTQLGVGSANTYEQSGASTGKDSSRENRSGSVPPEKNKLIRNNMPVLLEILKRTSNPASLSLTINRIHQNL